MAKKKRKANPSIKLNIIQHIARLGIQDNMSHLIELIYLFESTPYFDDVDIDIRNIESFFNCLYIDGFPSEFDIEKGPSYRITCAMTQLTNLCKVTNVCIVNELKQIVFPVQYIKSRVEMMELQTFHTLPDSGRCGLMTDLLRIDSLSTEDKQYIKKYRP